MVATRSPAVLAAAATGLSLATPPVRHNHGFYRREVRLSDYSKLAELDDVAGGPVTVGLSINVRTRIVWRVTVLS